MMKRIVIIFSIFFLGSEAAMAQQQKLDSLRQELSHHTKPNEIKLKLFNQLAETYLWMQIDSGIAYSNLAIELAIKLNHQKELADAYNHKGQYLTKKGLDSTSQNLIKKAIEINTKLKNNTGLADNYISLVIHNVFTNKADNVEELLAKAQTIYQQTKNNNGLGLVNYWKASTLIPINDSARIEVFQNAIQLFIEAKNIPMINASYNAIGVHYFNKNDFKKALLYFNMAIASNTKNNLTIGLIADYGNASLVYYYLSNFPKTLDYLLKGLRVSEQSGDSSGAGYCLNQIASLYLKMGHDSLALKYALKGIKMSEQVNDITIIPFSYLTAGTIYAKLNNSNLANEYLNKSMVLATQFKDSFTLSRYYFEIGKFQFSAHLYDKAIINLKKSYTLTSRLYGKLDALAAGIEIGKCITLANDELLIKAGIHPAKKNEILIEYFEQAKNESYDISVKRDACFELSKFYEQHGNLKKSFANYKLYILHRDSIMNTENSNALNNTQTQYETEKKEQQIALLNKDKSLQQTKIEKQKVTRNVYIGGIILVLLLASITLNRYMVKQKMNKQLALNLDQLKFTQNQLIENEKLASLGQLTAGIAHEIKNPLNFVNNFSELSNELIEELKTLDNEGERKELMLNIKENLSKINHHGKRAERIVSGMLMHSRDSSGERVETNINSLCNEVLDLTYKNNLLKFPDFSCEIKRELTADLPKINCVREDLSRVILNLLDNAFYTIRQKAKMHSTNEYKPKITVSTQLENNFIYISIKDNGAGISDTVKQKIFEPFYTTKPTGEGTGLGLSICNDIIKAHFGEIKVESELGIGTSFIISLPV